MYIQEKLAGRNCFVRYANPTVPQFFPPHFHDGYEFLYIAGGGGRCSVEGEVYEFSAGDMIITNPNEIHSMEMYADSERWYISFRPSYLSEFMDAEYNPTYPLQCRKVGTQNRIPAVLAQRYGLAVCMDNIRHLFFGTQPGRELLLKANLLVILEGIAQITQKNTPEISQDKLMHIISYINNHFTEDITVEAIAGHFFLSKSHLSHMFSEAMGIPLKNYITHKKIIYAKELMATDKSLTEIAFAAGYNDYSVFCRAFKQALRVTPSAYRKGIR